ncbi:MAG TPA: glycosyltransferase [Alphaproteobacteria bacterium]|nr:glycosyltransferase [Alphaproteobacteria bacterium]
MHIALVIPDLKGGGAQKMMINLANEFTLRGHKVDLLLLNHEGIYRGIINQSVNVIDFNKTRSLFAIPALAKYLKTKKPDIFLSALFHVNLVSILARILAGTKKTKIIISERNNLSLRLSEMNIAKRFLLKTMVKIFYPFADQIVGISNGVCDDLRKILKPEKVSFIQTIYNPVVTPDFEEKIKAETASPYPNNAGVKLVASGRLVLQKDYPTLIRALAIYREKYGAAHLVILGQGVLQDELETLSKSLNIKDNISFMGFVDNPLSVMKHADIFVVSSAWEGFCNVIVEGLYAGLKVVATDCPSGPAEILQNGKYGELVEIGNVEKFAEAIHTVSQKNISAEDQKKRAMDFTVEKKTEEFTELFKKVLSHG